MPRKCILICLKESPSSHDVVTGHYRLMDASGPSGMLKTSFYKDMKNEMTWNWYGKTATTENSPQFEKAVTFQQLSVHLSERTKKKEKIDSCILKAEFTMQVTGARNIIYFYYQKKLSDSLFTTWLFLFEDNEDEKAGRQQLEKHSCVEVPSVSRRSMHTAITMIYSEEG